MSGLTRDVYGWQKVGHGTEQIIADKGVERRSGEEIQLDGSLAADGARYGTDHARFRVLRGVWAWSSNRDSWFDEEERGASDDSITCGLHTRDEGV